MKTALLILVILMTSVFELRCQEDDNEITTLEQDVITTDEYEITTTTTDEYEITTTAQEHETTSEFATTTSNSRIPIVLDYKFSSLVGGLTVDVNLTEIIDSYWQTTMSMRILSTPDSPIAVEICQGRGTVKLFALNQENCDGVTSGATLDVETIAVLNKAGNF
jgi:hypothetical protein